MTKKLYHLFIKGHQRGFYSSVDQIKEVLNKYLIQEKIESFNIDIYLIDVIASDVFYNYIDTELYILEDGEWKLQIK